MITCIPEYLRILWYTIHLLPAVMAQERRQAYDYEDLESEFDQTERERRQTWRDDPLSRDKQIHIPQHSAAIPSKQYLSEERDKEEWRARRYHLLSMDAYSRHKMLVNQYLLATGRGIEQFKRPADQDRNDFDVLKEQHQFLWEGEADTWERRLAKAYYDKLFKEYTISDLSRYKENKIALRWRTEAEVLSGKGQFICGSKHCSKREELESWEVNFAYAEQGDKKNALVKLRLCAECSRKLNYHHKKKRWRRTEDREGERRRRHKHKKHKKQELGGYHSSSSSSSDTEGELNSDCGQAFG